MSNREKIIKEARENFPIPFKFYRKGELADIYSTEWRTIKKRLDPEIVEMTKGVYDLSPKIVGMIFEELGGVCKP